jgi:hypothetical protein
MSSDPSHYHWDPTRDLYRHNGKLNAAILWMSWSRTTMARTVTLQFQSALQHESLRYLMQSWPITFEIERSTITSGKESYSHFPSNASLHIVSLAIVILQCIYVLVYIKVNLNNLYLCITACNYVHQIPSFLRTLGSWVWIQLEAWFSVCVRQQPCGGLISHPRSHTDWL